MVSSWHTCQFKIFRKRWEKSKAYFCPLDICDFSTWFSGYLNFLGVYIKCFLWYEVQILVSKSSFCLNSFLSATVRGDIFSPWEQTLPLKLLVHLLLWQLKSSLLSQSNLTLARPHCAPIFKWFSLIKNSLCF